MDAAPVPLVAVQNGVWTDEVDDRRSTRTVLEVIRTTAGDEGLTRAQIVDLSAEHNLSRSSVYEAVKVPAQQTVVRNVGTVSRARYVIAGMSPMEGAVA